MAEMDEAIMRYLGVRDQQRADRVEQMLEAMTERERALVREAAVMGYVQGHMAGRAKIEAIPNDSHIVARVLASCLTEFDLYPVMDSLIHDRRVIEHDEEGDD